MCEVSQRKIKITELIKEDMSVKKENSNNNPTQKEKVNKQLLCFILFDSQVKGLMKIDPTKNVYCQLIESFMGFIFLYLTAYFFIHQIIC